jgi:hypothetical protein
VILKDIFWYIDLADLRSRARVPSCVWPVWLGTFHHPAFSGGETPSVQCCAPFERLLFCSRQIYCGVHCSHRRKGAVGPVISGYVGVLKPEGSAGSGAAESRDRSGLIYWLLVPRTAHPARWFQVIFTHSRGTAVSAFYHLWLLSAIMQWPGKGNENLKHSSQELLVSWCLEFSETVSHN